MPDFLAADGQKHWQMLYIALLCRRKKKKKRTKGPRTPSPDEERREKRYPWWGGQCFCLCMMGIYFFIQINSGVTNRKFVETKVKYKDTYIIKELGPLKAPYVSLRGIAIHI